MCWLKWNKVKPTRGSDRRRRKLGGLHGSLRDREAVFGSLIASSLQVITSANREQGPIWNGLAINQPCAASGRRRAGSHCSVRVSCRALRWQDLCWFVKAMMIISDHWFTHPRTLPCTRAKSAAQHHKGMTTSPPVAPLDESWALAGRGVSLSVAPEGSRAPN